MIAGCNGSRCAGGSPISVAECAAQNLRDFEALDPFFRLVEHGLQGLIEPVHFFDLMAEDVVTE